MLRERTQQYAEIEFKETTSSQGWAGFEITLAAESIEEVAAAATVALRGEIASSAPGQRAYISRCPFGVVFGAAPWNAAVTLGQRACLQPIMAGNTAILKTSEMSPKTHLMIAQVMHDAGLPEGVLNVVHVAPKDAPAVTEAIIAHPAIGKIKWVSGVCARCSRFGLLMTMILSLMRPQLHRLDSRRIHHRSDLRQIPQALHDGTRWQGYVVGSDILSACAHLLLMSLTRRLTAPAIVLADADLTHASNAIAFGAWFHSGQICMASQTAIVHSSIKTKFLSLLEAYGERLSAASDGAPLRGLFTDASAERVKEIVDEAMGKGARAAAGTKADVKGNVVQPLLLDGVTPDMRECSSHTNAPGTKRELTACALSSAHQASIARKCFRPSFPSSRSRRRKKLSKSPTTTSVS